MEIQKILELKYPKYAGVIIRRWKASTGAEFTNENFTAVNYTIFAEYLKSQVAASSAKTYLMQVKVCVNMLIADGELQHLKNGWDKAANIKGDQVAMCYLTEDEINALVRYQPKDEYERKVRAQFLIECFTGARSSDVIRLDVSNLDKEGNIVYVSLKTGVRAIVPCKPIVRDILMSGDNKEGTKAWIPLVTKNEIIRRMLQKAGVTEIVKVFKAGKELTGEKYKFCSTHTGRRSFASNMYLRGVDLYSISKLMGHSSTTMTERYICCGLRNLPQAALDYFK